MKKTIQTAAVLGMLAVAIGAFGAHGLDSILTRHGRLATFETAVKYHFYHTLAILFAGLLQVQLQENKYLKYSVRSFLAGVIIFSGSLYILSLTNTGWLGAVTPFGGLAFILGWIFLFLGAAGRK